MRVKAAISYLMTLAAMFSTVLKALPQVELHDINGVLTNAEQRYLEKLIAKQVSFHRQHLPLPDQVTIPVRIFEDSHAYRRFQQRVSRNSDSKNGFYSGRTKEAIINKNKRFLKTTVHEAQHVILNSQFKRAPKWLDQGLSEFYEMSYTRFGSVRTRVKEKREKRLIGWAERQSLPPLRVFFSRTRAQWSTTGQLRENPTLAWGLIYYFMSDMEKRRILSDIIVTLRARRGNHSAQIVDRAYPGGLRQLEVDFRLFVADMPSSIKLD